MVVSKMVTVSFGSVFVLFVVMAGVFSPWYLFGALYIVLLFLADCKLNAVRRRRRQARHYADDGCGQHHAHGSDPIAYAREHTSPRTQELLDEVEHVYDRTDKQLDDLDDGPGSNGMW